MAHTLPDAVIERVSVAGNNDVAVRIIGSRATIQPTAAAISRIAASSYDTAVFNLSEMPVDSASISRITVRQLAAADMGIEVSLPQGVITLDEEAVAALAAQAHTQTIVLRITEFEEGQLPSLMAARLPAGAIAYQVSVSSGSRAIRDFGDASITVWLPFAGNPPVAVWRMGPGSVLVPVPGAVFEPSTRLVRFTTSQLGIFVVGEA